MLKLEALISHLEDHIQEVLDGSTENGIQLWKAVLGHHPADIAAMIDRMRPERQAPFLKKLSKEVGPRVFERLAASTQSSLLTHLDIDQATYILQQMPSDKLTHLFDYVSDDHLQNYLKLLQKKQRTQIISSLNFLPKSAGRIMTSDVLTFPRDFTVKKSIGLLQRIGSKRDVLQHIYLTDEQHMLAGYIKIEDLVLSKPETPLMHIMFPCDVIARVDDDQEEVARQMKHYDLFSVPVVEQNNHFLGVITADDIFDVIEEEAGEEVYKMSGLSPIEDGYLQTSFWTLIRQRSVWLVGLLFLQSFSSEIMSSYDWVFEKYTIFTFFLTMLMGTGGNAGNQSATLVIRGLTTGEINRKTSWYVLMREMMSASVIGALLGCMSFIRVYTHNQDIMMAGIISLVLFCIIMCSMTLGTAIPLLLDRMGIDPAHSAAPFLATIMDILGILILCMIAARTLS